MKFGERLLSSQHPPWSEHYVDYLRLKRLLGPLFELDEDGSGLGSPLMNTGESSGSLLHHYDVSANNNIPTFHNMDVAGAGVASSHSFQKELNYEIQKALLFLMKTMGELASDLSVLSDQQRFMSVNVKSLLDEWKGMMEQQLEQVEIPDLQQQKDQLQHTIPHQLHDIENLRWEYLVRVGSKLLLLLEFVELNIEAIVKIVKKHDKLLSRRENDPHPHPTSRSTSSHTTTIDDKSRYTRLRRQYLPRFAVCSPEPNVRCLFLAAADAGDCKRVMSSGLLRASKAQHNQSSDGSFGGWDVIQYNLEVALEELFHWGKDLQELLNHCSTDHKEEPAITPKNPSKPLLSRSFSEIPLVPTYSGSSLKRFIARSSSILVALNTPENVDGESSFFEPVLYQIQSSRRRLGQMHHRYIRMVYAHEMLHLIDDRNGLEQEDEKYMMQRRDTMESIRKQSIGGEGDAGKMWTKPQPTVSNLSKFLNLASAGLYMCNYNIVAPTSGLYAKHLGFDPANAGIIIGMTPAAVILSSVLYSWWSSYSYKRALMFASVCCSVGNIVYALALPCNSLTMVLLGRMLTGFGSARVINRRYIADYYSIEDRTSGMASFVSASALGMALGPGLAASLSIAAPTEGRDDTKSFWTVETAPGYIMFVLWAIYLVCNVMFFEEPDRVDHSAQPKNGPQAKSTTALAEKTPLLNGPKGGSLFTYRAVSPATNHAKAALPARQSILKSCGNVPVSITLLLLLLLKSVLEGVSSSAPTISRFYFGWGVHASGIYLALLASFVLPTNHVVAYISRRFDDRELILGALVVMFLGILGFLVYSEDGTEYSETRFILFGLAIFVACNALEGPTMGLLSKTIPKSLARGILNAGLLATEAGTIGRVVGDFWLSSAAFQGLNHMINKTFEPMCAMVGVSIFATLWGYPYLQPRFEDEDDDDD